MQKSCKKLELLLKEKKIVEEAKAAVEITEKVACFRKHNTFCGAINKRKSNVT